MSPRREGKVWVIDEVQDVRRDPPVRSMPAAPGTVSPKVRSGVHRAPRPAITARMMRSRTGGPLRGILLAYLLGPFAPRLRRPHTCILAGLALAGLAVCLAGKLLDTSALAQGRPQAQIAFAAALAMLLLLAGTWSAALFRAGREQMARQEALPAWLRQPGVLAFLGIWLPGFALLLARRPGRAALALLNGGVLLAALLIILRPVDASSWRVWTGYERILITGFFIACLAALAALAWALEGLRLQLSRAKLSGGLRGDRLALWLLASLGLFFFAFQPGSSAADLHRSAALFEAHGYRLIPLTLERLALKLDDAQPEYWLAGAHYCDALGRSQDAARLRGELWLRWRDWQEVLPAMPCAAPTAKAAPSGPAAPPWL